jgi:hypothetical protein
VRNPGKGRGRSPYVFYCSFVLIKQQISFEVKAASGIYSIVFSKEKCAGFSLSCSAFDQGMTKFNYDERKEKKQNFIL